MGIFTVVHRMWCVHIKAAIGRCFDTLGSHQHAPSEDLAPCTQTNVIQEYRFATDWFGDYFTPDRIDIVVQVCLDISTPSLLWNSLIS